MSGVAWAKIWLPAVLEDDADVLRVAPITNSGELLGLIVVRRPVGALQFSEADEQALTELARQVGLALHNVKLDSALQESLDEVRRQADELRASRMRIVEAGDAQRRAIERDLHDGAQQHLVALAVSVNLARQISDSDPEAAKGMLEQIGKDLREAVQELRNLAHGIYPPLLMDRGLPEALSAAAGRAALPTGVEAEGIGRYAQQIEAAVYFCVLEALQNAAKHAGAGSQASVSVREEEGALLFDVVDDGAGFDMSTGAHHGHGFVNMSDRVGAIGGSIAVESSPGQRHPDLRPHPARRVGGRGPSAERARRIRRGVAPDVADDVGAELLLVHVAGRAARDRVGREIGLLVGGEQHHHGAGVGGGDLAGRLDAVDPGQVDVHQHEAGLERFGQLDRFLAALGLADDVEPGGGGDHHPHGAPKRRLVVDDEHGDRIGHGPILPGPELRPRVPPPSRVVRSAPRRGRGPSRSRSARYLRPRRSRRRRRRVASGSRGCGPRGSTSRVWVANCHL